MAASSGNRFDDIDGEIRAVHNKANFVDERFETMDRAYRGVPVMVGKVENQLADKCNKLDELDWRNKVHAAKIKALQTDLQYTQRHTHAIKDYLLGKRLHALSDIDPKEESDAKGDKTGTPQSGRHGEPHARKTGDTFNASNYFGNSPRKDDASGRKDGNKPEEKYLGMDRYYNPDSITAYRMGHGPEYHRKVGDKPLTYADHPTDRTSSYRDKPLTYADHPTDRTSSYRDARQYFSHDTDYETSHQQDYRRMAPPYNHNVKQLVNSSTYDSDYPNPRQYDPSKYYNFDGPQQLRNSDILAEQHNQSTVNETGRRVYDEAYTNPGAARQTENAAGGFYFIRYRNSGYDAVRIALTKMKTTLRSSNGRLMGIAKRDRILVMEGTGGWYLDRDDGSGRYRKTENSMAVLWFSSMDKCDEFMRARENPFREGDFPTQHGYDSFFLPLLTMPVFGAFPTFLLMELTDVHQYKEEDMTQFEAEVRHEISQEQVPSLPFIISKMHGPGQTKPGPYVGKWNVKVYVSRFQNQNDVDYIWGRGIIQEKLKKFRLTGGLHVSSFSILD